MKTDARGSFVGKKVKEKGWGGKGRGMHRRGGRGRYLRKKCRSYRIGKMKPVMQCVLSSV